MHLGPTFQECSALLDPLANELFYERDSVCVNLTLENITSLLGYCSQIRDLELEGVFSKPMVWIGIYISIASLFCIVAMGADLLHGFRNRKFWFPCNYFTLNAASITMIAIAMKLPVDLTSLFESCLDQATKIGSMAFMCTMMANFIPSLASMENDTLLANVIGLAILVITVIVNICIQISTGAINDPDIVTHPTNINVLNYMVNSYVAISLWLLIILISSAITIPAFKQHLETKYQVTTKRTLYGQDSLASIVEKLNLYLRRYWVMAETGSPQFVMASNPLSIASDIICVFSFISYIVLMYYTIPATMYSGSAYDRNGKLIYRLSSGKESDYKWSMYFIAMTQSIGVVVGSIAPIFRCFMIINFESFTKQNKNQFMIFKVEKYWIQKLGEWKGGHLRPLSSRSKSRILALKLKNQFLGICIGTQKIIVVSSKMMGLIPVVFLICIMYCSYWWKSMMARLFVPSDTPKIDEINEDLWNYVLQLEDEMELGEGTLKRISNSIDQLIKKAEKKQQKNLLMLLEKYNGFSGVENFNNDQVPPLTSFKLVNSWSLPVVTMTCIAIALPNISKDKIDSLFKSVREGLLYTHLVEECLNNTCEYGNIRNATMTLWHEVEEKSIWLENTLETLAYRGKTSIEILQWFADKAEEIIMHIISTNKEVMENTPKKLILANSMYRITRTILLNYQSNVKPISEEELFALLSSMIADILCACFTNIPRVIMMKCHGSVIEKREASVKAAAKLFGSSKEVVKRLDTWVLPSIDPNKMPFIDEWNFHMKQSIP
uniref:uncharacterized protein LOC122604508 n=1 Tax=Erigeron canadensis TaxID=72917 RepID=UPI001CB897E4|nr:uncharacterized protein LOC122604508 [Erigeron canadensis]